MTLSHKPLERRAETPPHPSLGTSQHAKWFVNNYIWNRPIGGIRLQGIRATQHAIWARSGETQWIEGESTER
jgi:hypothetical protein